ncbi:MAG: MFS transporter [Cytophagaceae bacterium]
MQTAPQNIAFTPYEKFVITILTILQFTIILDFMVLSPLGAIVMPQLHIGTADFGLIVSGYAFSAGASGLLAAGFADKFDRKKLLLFFYVGFIAGTFLCAVADSHRFLLGARIITGIFGGVLGSVGFAIVTDLFRMEVRGRVMGFMQMSFAASQVLGIPLGLYMATHFGWSSPFWLIAGFSIIVAVLVFIYMKPVTEHLKVKSDRNPFLHLIKTLSEKRYFVSFGATALLAIGGFMLMPFGSAFSTQNLGVKVENLTILYAITGAFTMIFGPLIGKLSDKAGKYKVFMMGTCVSMVMVLIYTHLGLTPFWMVVAINAMLFVGITSRIITASALTSAIPSLQDRGAFMSVNSSIQQISGGIAAAVAGTIVIETKTGLENYDVLGYVTIVAALVSIGLLYFVNKQVESASVAKPQEKVLSEA